MQEILIFRHAPHEGPGYLAEYLDRRKLPHRLIRIDQNDPIPTSLDGIPGIVLMGGPMSVNDKLPWIPKVTRLIREAVEADRPVLGHCLGGQLISKALGGVITKNPVKEIGWLPVTTVQSSSTPNWLRALPDEFDVLQWHGETFSLPDGATHLLRSRDCANQAFVLGNTIGFQCHIEMTSAMVREWVDVGKDDLAPVCATVQNPQTILDSLDQRVATLQHLADVFYDQWIKGLH